VNSDRTPPGEIAQLIADLESWNPTKVREAAVAKINTLTILHQPIIEALSRVAKDSPYSDLGKSALASIDTLYVSSRIGKSHQPKKMLATNVEIISEEGSGLEVTSAKAYCRCNFCNKETIMTSAKRRFTERLSGSDRFFCTFCLRHRLNQRDSRHTLIMSYRGIIGYYYYAFYALSKNVNMSISEIWDYVHLHASIGNQNPLFLYDPESFLWFIDFSRIGSSSRKMNIKDVLGTVAETLMAFALHENIKDVKPHKMYLKYEEAIVKFYHQRSRPSHMRVLSPTLKSTGANDQCIEKLGQTYHTAQPANERKKIPIEETRNFLPQILYDAVGRKY
jgi:hypothetical protein